MGTFNKVKEKKRNRTREHPGNTRETPGKHPGNVRKGAFTNVFVQRSRFRKKNFFSESSNGISLQLCKSMVWCGGTGQFLNFLDESLSFTLLKIPTFLLKKFFSKLAPLIQNISKCTFPGCFRGISWVFHGCFTGVSRVFPGCFPGIPEHFFLHTLKFC